MTPNPSEQTINLNVPRRQEVTWPVWGNKEEMHITVKKVTGAMAMWAVIQSPYEQPRDLSLAIEVLGKQLSSELEFDEHGFTAITIEDLRTYLIKALENLSAITQWNEPKIQTGALFQGSSSRYHTTKPDYDFIDLHALARNVAHTCGMEYFYWKGN